MKNIKIEINCDDVTVEGFPGDMNGIVKNIVKNIYKQAVNNCNMELYDVLE